MGKRKRIEVKRLYRITLTQGFDKEKVELVSYLWATDIKDVHDKLIDLVELTTNIEIERVKWWQWR